MPVIIYIVGVGHSGSTLLDLLLGSHSKAFSVGELIALSSTERKMRRQRVLERPCDCGAPMKISCPIWSEVERRLQQTCATSLRTIEVESADPDEFRTVNREIYDAIAEVSGRPYIVESSKKRASTCARSTSCASPTASSPPICAKDETGEPRAGPIRATRSAPGACSRTAITSGSATKSSRPSPKRRSEARWRGSVSTSSPSS
jgi:hypothetical protein